MSVVPMLVVVVLMLVSFLGAGAGGGSLHWAVLPHTLLLSTGVEGTSPTEVVGSVSRVTADLGEGLFFLDLLLNLVLDVTLVGVRVESVVGVEEGHVAQGDVLAAPTVGNLLSVKVSAHTDSLVAVVVINKDDHLASVEGNVVLGGEDLNSTAWVRLDAGNVVVALWALALLADGEWQGNSLSVDHGGDVTGWLDLGEAATWNAALTGKDDLSLGEDELELHVVGTNVLGQDSHGVFTGSVGGQEVVASLGDFGIEFGNNIVKAGDGFALQLASCCIFKKFHKPHCITERFAYFVKFDIR